MEKIYVVTIHFCKIAFTRQRLSGALAISVSIVKECVCIISLIWLRVTCQQPPHVLKHILLHKGRITLQHVFKLIISKNWLWL